MVIRTVAQAPAPATPAPTTPGATPTTPGALGTVPAAKAKLPLGTVKPPKIPLTQVTPKASEAPATTPTTETKATTPASTTPTSSSPSGSGTSGGGGTSEEAQQTAILLDTNAASTYNPYGYPASGFGDPSLAIDGDTSTAWTAAVDPATAPKMADGLLIDLKGKQKSRRSQLDDSDAGDDRSRSTAPTSPPRRRRSPTPRGSALSRPGPSRSGVCASSLRESTKAFTFITVWISQAPASAIGTPQAPGHVSVNELELFPTR